jgi:phosphoglycolate phosphatase
MITNIFFDLDGTLTDSQEGIRKCLQYALEKLDCPYPAGFEDNSFIGPPLRVTFKKLFHTEDEALIEKAIEIYRERFSTIGLFENKVYPDIPEMLSALHSKSLKLYVVTSKAKIYADRIIEHFGLSPWFTGIYGPELGGRFENKADLIKHILDERALSRADAVMIGDRKEDIIAGKTNGIKTIGVTYGYGSLREIKDALPDYVCNSPMEIQKLLIGKS